MSEDIFLIRYQAKEKETSCLFFVPLDIGIIYLVYIYPKV